MKKIFLTLSLFIFSIQGLASSCLDGREPVKSISEDGTYFVFHCEASVDNSDKDDNGITLGE